MNNNYTVIADMVREAERHADDLSRDRLRSVEYYQGEMNDTPSDKGRSKMVSRDVRAHLKKVLPSIMRVIFGGSNVVEYQPAGPGDEESSEQATDYVNQVVVPEADIRGCIHDAIHDALLLRNGILKWEWYEKQAVKISKHSGLSEDEMAQIAASDDVEILEHTEREEQTELGALMVHDMKIRRVYPERCVKARAVPRERLLIHPEAITFDDSLLTGEKTTIRRSDLIAMGYDEELVMGLPIAGEEDDDERGTRRGHATDNDEAQRANEAIDYYDMFIRVDLDGDGISELRHMCFAGGLTERNLLIDDEVDEVQMCDVAVMRQPHQWEGISLADDLMDVQRAKTVLLRQTLDNIYWQNNPQPMIQGGAIKNLEAVYNPEFGKPIETHNGISVRDALGFNQVPFVAKDSFAMMEYLDGEATDRTGVSDSSSGLAPDALQNMTAKASAMIEQAGIGQTEMMVQTISESLKPFFIGILRLVTRHQDKPRTVRLRGDWVEFDPRHWNADMDVDVNTGLGAGTRERDMQMMQVVMQIQKEIIEGFGSDNPFVKPDNLWNTLSKLVESAGLKTPQLYFTEPDEQEVAAQMEAQRSKPDPEQQKLQAQMQVEQAKMKTNRDKEKSQMEADLMVERARIEADTTKQTNELAVKERLQDKQLAWDREQFSMKLAAESETREKDRQDRIWQAQAAGFEQKEVANG